MLRVTGWILSARRSSQRSSRPRRDSARSGGDGRHGARVCEGGDGQRMARRLPRVLCRRCDCARQGVTPAKEGLRKQPSTPFSEFELVWEPRTGRCRGQRRSRLAHRAEHVDQSYVKEASQATAATCRSGGSSRTASGGSSSTSAPARRAVPFAPGFTRIAVRRAVRRQGRQGGSGQEPGRGRSRSQCTDRRAGRSARSPAA